MPLFAEGTLLDGRYRVLRHLGSGGMASVLLCQDERLGRQVAVKRLHADSPADVEQRFVREARLGALLNHPNLVSVYDTATEGEGVLIVMEYVAGEALAQTLKRGPLRPRRVSLMLRDLGSALDHVHAHGVVHRDVKPGNVLLRKDGVTKLVDLGIAMASDQTRITSSGMVLGTATYMAPEQLEGGETSPATDIYAMAVVAYEALTGQRARSGRTPMEIAHRIATSPPPDLRKKLPDAPAAAARLLEQGMARDPAERPRSAGELATRLARALEAPKAVDEPPTAVTRASPQSAAAPAKRPPAAARPATRRSPPAPARIAPSPPAPPARSGKRPVAAIATALVILALAAAVAIAAVLSGGGGGEASQTADQPNRQQNAKNAKKKNAKKRQQRQNRQKQTETTPESQAQPAPTDTPAAEEQTPVEEPDTTDVEPQQPATTIDPARGAALNDQGFALMQQGNFDAAVPVLEQAVASYPEDSQEIGYAYALFNLGKSLNRSGRPDEAIPFLERRLRFADQRATVQAELDDARARAG